MKRILITVFLLLALLAVSSLAEREIYAEQDGVRVFRENGLVGLMDADENVLLDAQFKVIYPFTGDYAIAENRYYNEKGVISKDGRIVIPCGYMDLYVWPEQDRATAYTDDYEYGRFVDLTTGENVLEGHCIIWMEGGDTVRMSFGDYSGWDFDGPYCVEEPFYAEVFDERMNLRFGVDRRIIKRMGDGYYLIESSEEDAGWILADFQEAYRIVDGEGREVLGDLCAYPWEDSDGIHYARAVCNPLRSLYDSLKRRAPEAVLSARERVKKSKTAFRSIKLLLKSVEVQGILHPDGSRMEIMGSDLSARDEDGLYRVKRAGLWGYADGNGEWVIPPKFGLAYGFSGGTAVVGMKDGDNYLADRLYFLVDRNGEQVGNLTWSSRQLDYGIVGDDADNLLSVTQIIPVETDGGIVLYDRRGERITDEVFYRKERSFPRSMLYPGEDASLLDVRTIAVKDTEGNGCLIRDDGTVLLRMPGSISPFYGENMIVAGKSGTERIIRLNGADGFEWLIEPKYKRICFSDGYEDVLWAEEEDGSCWYLNRNGEILCPAWGYHW
ncbi:MAG: WG repeat-containing protein [Clostridia bacterium]|nr:WG repeat-containing protein [Clostridia bacterium]